MKLCQDVKITALYCRIYIGLVSKEGLGRGEGRRGGGGLWELLMSLEEEEEVGGIPDQKAQSALKGQCHEIFDFCFFS
jgi:hypothetical protein